jgi:hypothetical protein
MAFGVRLMAVLLTLMTSSRAGANDADRPVLYSVYGSDILVRLQRIHAHPDRDGPDGVLIVTLAGRSPAYVQCRFTGNGGVLLCEAVVGAYPPKPGATVPAIAAATEEGLRKAGYYRDASGRAVFPYEILPDSGIWGGAAVTILAPLIEVFGARAASRIDIIAPLAPKRDEAAIQRELSR